MDACGTSNGNDHWMLDVDAIFLGPFWTAFTSSSSLKQKSTYSTIAWFGWVYKNRRTDGTLLCLYLMCLIKSKPCWYDWLTPSATLDKCVTLFERKEKYAVDSYENEYNMTKAHVDQSLLVRDEWGHYWQMSPHCKLVPSTGPIKMQYLYKSHFHRMER